MSAFIKTDLQPPQPGDLETWLVDQLKTCGDTLLAFADDGVIWGRLVDGKLERAPEAPALREVTLQQAFVFGAEGEVRLFRDEMFTDKNPKWKTLRLVDGDDPALVIKESQVLWGDKVTKPAQNGFFYAEEYRAGIAGQWLPLDEPFGPERCARLEVHHLVEFEEETGEARIVASRLAGLSVGKRAMEVEK